MAVKKEVKATTTKKVKKTTPKVEEKEVVVKAEKKSADEVYFYGVGRRKASVAQVRLFTYDKATDSDFVINKKKLIKW